ncbi:hypothetical protein ACFQ8C_09975 [Streptomyces sp. NPDC056503]|uniref:hypothetical protein n=1 Tax=Streptomyces sp. NPDC056503 TaxID=3345842 RepID=UPI00367F9ADA
MSRAVRWVVAGVTALVTFGVGVWVVRALPWGWLPQEDGARLDTALAFGAIAGTAVLTGLGWWAAREPQQPAPTPTPAPVPPARTLVQTATAGDDAEIRQSGGGAAAHLEQHAEASESGHVTQSGRGTDAGYERVEQRGTATGRGRVEQSGDDDRPAPAEGA